MIYKSIKHKTAIITGASEGIGRAIAENLAKNGAKILLISRDEKNLLKLKSYLKKKYSSKVEILAGDVKDITLSKKIIDNTKSFFGDCDILINNAGGPPPGSFLDHSEEIWNEYFNQNLLSIIRLTKLVVPQMKKNKWGRIINMASVSVKEPLSYLAMSNSIRAAVTTWAKTLSNDLGPYNITVNNILTGYFNTERINEINSEKAKKLNIKIEKVYDAMKDLVPLKRLGDPKEFAYLLTFLASENSAYINGANIPIDGGLIKSL